MCIRPNNVWVQRGPKWEQQPVACRQCWRCRQNRVNDYIGRALAEAAVSETVAMVQLTYAPRDDLADKVIHPRHFQLFMKRLRFAGHKVRYLVCGEYGDLKGRAHFHALLFFKHIAPRAKGEPVPFYNWSHIAAPESSGPFCREIPSDRERMVHIREWPHGHITCEWDGGEAAARYVCNYLLFGEKSRAWFSLSKKPALGAEWFARKAAKGIELGVIPSRFEYLPPGGDTRRPYLMTGATRRDYLEAVTEGYEPATAFFEGPPIRNRMGEWVAKSFDKLCRQMHERALAGVPIAEQIEATNQEIALREQPIHKVLARVRWDDIVAEEAARDWDGQGWAAWVAKQLRFENNEQGWQAFYEENPAELERLCGWVQFGPWQHVPGCACTYCLGRDNPERDGDGEAGPVGGGSPRGGAGGAAAAAHDAAFDAPA